MICVAQMYLLIQKTDYIALVSDLWANCQMRIVRWFECSSTFNALCHL